MPLEDLTGNRYVSDLNEDWPKGTDLPDSGDNHIRGIKNVLKKTFPNLTGPVTRSNTDINTGTVPAGSSLPFYGAAAAPTGWARVAINNSYMMRVVPNEEDSTGGGHGTDDPILNNKVPEHTHPVSANTTAVNLTHQHGLVLQPAGEHYHTIPELSVAAGRALGSYASWNYGAGLTNTSTVSAHTHDGNTDQQLGIHSHYISTATSKNIGASNWTPRYVNVMMCVKQ